jgi:hypothetical protein
MAADPPESAGQSYDGIWLDRLHDRGSSFSGLFTRFEIGQIRISSAGKVTKRSCGSGSLPSQRLVTANKDRRHPVVDALSRVPIAALHRAG